MSHTASPVVRHEGDVVIVGLGPVGLLASIMLGRRGYTVHGVERWPDPYALPRAVTFDHEIARLLHALGINSDDDPSIDYHEDHYYWVDRDLEILMEVDWISKETNGWRNRYWFSQPELEDRMRVIAATLPTVHLHPGNEVFEFAQDDEGVTVRYHEVEAAGGVATPKEGGAVGEIRARWAIGSDGANSFVRRSVGAELTDLSFYSDWLVVDTTPQEMPHYMTAHFQICDPARPTTVVPGGPGRRRWEFQALEGEDRAELASPAKVWELLEPWGLTPDNAVLDRAVVWRFQAKYLENWRHGRALLAGDAAHLMPPFAGEGMCAGLRDAFNLVWRLDLVLQGKADASLLDAWSDERREQAKWYIDFSVGLGKVICITDEQEAAERNARMKAEHAQRVGPIPTHEAILGPGTWIGEDALAGKTAIQGRVAHAGRTGRFDDVLGVDRWFLLSAPGTRGQLDARREALLAGLGGVHLEVGAAGSGADVVDIDGVYGEWFAAHGPHLLVRPDFYVAFTATDADQLGRRLDEIAAGVLTGSGS